MAFTPIDEEEIIDEPVAEEAKPRFIPIEDDEFFGIGGEKEQTEPVVAPETTEPVEAPKSRFTPISEEEFFGLPKPTEPIPVTGEEGFLRQAADVPLKIGESINTSLRALTDLFGADNAVSQNLTQNAEWYRSLLSAQALEDEQEIGRILQEAENEGVLDQLSAGLEAFSVAPVDFVASGIGSLAVFAATGVAGRAAAVAGAARAGLTGAKAARFVQRGVQATQLATGAGMGAGIVKGEIYQSVKDEMLAQGKTEEEAKGIAMDAQSYMGKNLDQILLGAGLGTIDAFTGAEKIIGKVLTKGGLKPDASRIGNILKNGITEAAPEFVQAAQEKFASNLALQREGVDVSLTQGVFSQGALEGLVGLGMGVGAGAIEPRIQTEPTKEEVSAAAAETQDVARRSMDVAPATASLVEGEAEQIIQSQAETPDERVARLQREAQEAAGEIELEEEGAGLPPVEPTPPVTPTPEAAVAPVEPVVPAVVVEPPEGVGIAPPPPRQEFTDLINEGETSDDAYQRYQSQIDEIEDRLEAEGVDIVKLVDPTLAGAQNLIGQEGYTEMPPDLVEAYARREAVGAGQLAQSVGELTEALKNQNISEQDIKRVLDTYAIDVGKVDAFAQYKANEYTKAKVEAPPITQLERVAIALAAERGEMFDAVEDISKETLLDAGRAVKAIQDYFGVRPTEQQRAEFSRVSGVEFAALPPTPEAAPAAVEPTPVAPPPVAPQLEPLRRVARAEQTEEDVSGLVDAGFAEVYNGQPVLTQAGIDALPEAERPRLTPEARKIQIDTRTSEAAAEAISKNLRIGVDQVPVDVRMPAGWTLVGDVYVPPQPQAPAPTPEVRESRREGGSTLRITADDARELQYKIGTLLENADLQSDYGITREQAKQIYNSIPTEGGNWSVPAWANQAIKGELEDQAKILGDMADDARGENRTGEALRMNKQAKRFKQLSESVSAVRESRRAITPQQDRDYLDAVERGDLDAASRMVDDAAKRQIDSVDGIDIEEDWAPKAGEEVERIIFGEVGDTIEASEVGNLGLKSTSGVYGLHWGDPDYWKTRLAEDYGRDIGEAKKIYITVAEGDRVVEDPQYTTDPETGEKATAGILVTGRRILRRGIDFRVEGEDYQTDDIPKTADPVIRDDQGNVIPLSQRFQPEQADIRYARREQQLANSLDSGDFVSAQALVDGGATMDRATFLRSITPSATQRATTIHTRLERDGIISKDEFANEQGLVYGDGRGAASTYLGAESYEPFPPAGFAPDYSGDRVAGQGAPIDKKFRIILNTFVLNVVDPQTRSFIVKDIANLLENGGRAVFVTRGKDVANSQALVSFGPLERIQRSEGKLTYQKGFTQPELIQYIQETLGDGFEVRALRGGSASDVRVEVVKNTDATLNNPPIVPEARERRRVQMGRAGMETSAVEARLQELGFPTGGIIRVVNQPDADFEGRTIILDGKVTGIELNASALKDNAAIDRVLNHEFAESANADGALNRLVERLTPKEKKEINDTITRLRYEERARTSEEAARAIETLAEAWKGRGFFTRAVARVEAWASKLGFKLTRRAAEYIAARNLAEVNENVRKWHIGEAMANIKGARKVSFNGLQAILIPPSEMRVAYSIAAYHGTPHEIKGRFQVAKIGTGEGATAYGWGLYFAENIEVAKEYQRNLSKGQYALSYEGVPVNELPTDQKNAILKIAAGISRETVIADLETSLRRQEASKPEDWAVPENRERVIAELKSSIEEARKIKPSEIKPRTAGNLYRVELDLNENELLDWDLPLNEQSNFVRNALEKAGWTSKGLSSVAKMYGDSGKGLYDAIDDDLNSKQAASESLLKAGIKGIKYLDAGSRAEGGTYNYVVFDENLIKITGRNGKPVDIRESRREPEAIPTFTEGTPEAATLKEMAASMAKVDAASEAKGGKPETYKISEIASVWMDSGLGERELQDAIVEYTNLTPANAARVAKAINKQYGLQQQIAETGAVIAEIAPEPEGAPRKSAVTKLIEQTTGVRKPVVKLQVSESAALKKQIQLKAREARETRKARKEAAEELAKSITDYVKANPIRGPINSRQAMSITKKALKLDVNNEAAVDRFEMYVERVIENANYDQDLADARALIKRAKAFAKAKGTEGNVKVTLEAIANVAPALLNNPFEFNLVVQRYLLGLAPVTAKQYAVMPDADVRRYLESLETQIKDNQEVLDRSKAQRILDKQAAYAEEKGIPLDEAISILNSEEFLQEKTIEKLEDLTKLLTAMAQESQKDVKAYDDSGATPKQKELISFMRKVNLDSLINEEKKRYIRFANNLLANGATFGMEQFQSIALGQEAAMKAVKDKRLSNKLSAWISPIGGDKAIDTARRIAAKTQSEADTFKNIFGREAVGAFRNILGLNRLDVAQTDSNRAKEQIANEFGEYFKGLRKKYGDDATGFEAKGYAGIAGYLIQTDGNKTEAESIPYRRRLMEQNIVELRKSDKQADLAEADLKERALAQLTGATNAEILSQLRALNPASYEQLMWVKDVMLPKWRDFLKEHDENFRNQANNYNNPDHLTITYKFPEGQLLPSEMEDVYQQDMIGMRIKQAANSIKRKDHPNLPVSKAGTIANIDINFGYNQYNALVDQVDKAFVAPAWEQVVAFTKAPEFEQVMGGRANALFVKNLLRDIQTSRSRQSLTDDEAQLIAGGVRLARKISTQAVLGGFTQPLRQVPDQLSKLFFTTGRFDLITKNLLTTAQAAPLLNKFPISRRGDAQAGTQYASQFNELARKVEASVTDRKWAQYRELMNKVGEFWMTPLRGSDIWAAKVSWMSYYEAELNKKGIKMESWEREAELVDTDQDRKEAAAYAEFAVDFYGGASDPTKMAALSKQSNNGWKEFAKLVFLPLNSFALQQKNSLISDLRDAYLRTGDRKASVAAIAGTLAGMAAFHGMRVYIIGGLIYPAGKALLMGIFGIDMDEPDEEEKQKQLEDNWRKFKASMYGNIIAGGAGEFAEKAAIDAVNRTAYLWDANINPDSLLNEKGEIMSFRQYEKEVSPLYRFRSYGSSEYSFGLADVLTEQATHALAETQQLMTPEEMEKYTGNEQAYAAFATGVEWMYFFRLMDTDVKRIATDLKRQMDKEVKEREAELKRIREGR